MIASYEQRKRHMEDISPRVLQIKVMKNMADARMLQHQMEKMRAEMLVNTDGMTALEFLYINPAESPVGLRAQEVFGRFEVAVINGVQATMALARNAGDDIAPAIKSILNDCIKDMGEWHDVAIIAKADRYAEYERMHDAYSAETGSRMAI